MDKETLSNYGWIVICVLVLAVMLALASPFGSFVLEAVQSTTQGLFDVNQSALEVAGIDIADNSFETSEMDAKPELPPDTDTVIYNADNLDPNIEYVGIYVDASIVEMFYGEVPANLVIPAAANVDGVWYRVTGIANDGFTGQSSIASIIIPETVTYIGSNAFCNCTNLSYIVIPDTVTRVSPQAFYGCTSLKSVTLPSTIDTIYGYTFTDCTSLESISIPNTLTSLRENAFSGWTSLTTITYNGTISEWSAIRKGGNGTSAWNYNTGEYTVYCIDGVVGKENIPTFISINEVNRYMIGYTDETTNLTIPATFTLTEDFFTYTGFVYKAGDYKVTSINGMAFEDCTNLVSVTIPNTVTSIGMHAFDGCTNLSSINIQNSVTSIGQNAFYNCTNLTSISIPASVTSIGTLTFNRCTKLTSITVDQENTKYSSVDGILFSKDGSRLICCPANKSSVTIPDSVTTIDYYAFEYAKIRTITIPDSVTSIGTNAFQYCSNLKSVTLSSNLTEIKGSTFHGCTSLTSITIPDSVTTIGMNAFATCSNLTSITIPKSVNTIKGNTFYYCTNLSTINYNGTMEEWNTITKSTTSTSLWDSNTGNYTIYCTDGTIAKS